MADGMGDPSDVLMLHGVVAVCADCGEERVFVPTAGDLSEYCCTSCDAAVFLLAAVQATGRARCRVA
jgi:hypothetical protein